MTIGVEMTEMSSKTKAASSRIVNGVAGRNILKVWNQPPRNDCICRRLQDAAVECVELTMRGGSAEECGQVWLYWIGVGVNIGDS